MFGSLPRIRRPVILILVYGVFLALVGITATAQSLLVASHFSTSTLNAVVGSDAATTRAFVNAYVLPRYLDPNAGPTPAELEKLEAQLASLTRPGEILRVDLRAPDGRVIASTDASANATLAAPTSEFSAAAGGASQAAILDAGASGAGHSVAVSTVLREFLPLKSGGDVRAVVGIWRDAGPILAQLDTVRRDVVIVTLSAGIVAAVILFLIFRSAQGRLTRQTDALVESTRRDPLTGLLNHGALVGLLAGEIEAARASGRPIGLALVDIDNFRLLNDNHGHAAGDQALLAVASILAREAGDEVSAGRYGPDEFLLVARPENVVSLEPILRSTQTGLSDLSLQFEATERLPITVSAAICHYPDHGASMTVLLATASRTLEEAKASGGDSILVASRGSDEATAAAGFDVLQGLVHAVDTKDRYTKRHSADVSRYSAFLAERLGLDSEFLETVRVAGLLHDVGKIGIPDEILRKPGKLTAAEYDIVKQHVALGDMIVRDVANLDLVRAGIRHHHERWDGDGYLDRLAGLDIPLIGRILAVGDAFSAMTTTRPYRKALDLQEALRRLEDAAGSQLEERLVGAFIEGIETADDPPLPDAARPAAHVARARVA
jgi:diguanylate cyclase (GGDEF)-like protein/putative nucleotidyltransferase with HDIG domain